MSNCNVKLKEEIGTYEVKFNLTTGEVVALRNALINYDSPMGKNVSNYLCNALSELAMHHDLRFLINE